MEVAFLGLGIMGSRMAAALASAGHDVTAWTNTDGKAAAWAQENRASAARTPADAAAAGDVVITMLVDGPIVQRVMRQAAEGARDGALFIDMSTIAPDESRALATWLRERSIGFIDAPVTGSAPRAQDGTLTIMAGADAADFERARPLFEAMGSLVLHVGEVGQGELIKLISNSVTAANALAVAQALVLAQATGADLDAIQQVMASGSAGSAMLELKGGPMRAHDFAPMFKAEHLLKDVRLGLEEAQRVGAPFSTAALAREALAMVCARGHAEDDFAVIVEAVEVAAGVRVSS